LTLVMKNSRTLLLSCIAVVSFVTQAALAADEDTFLGQISPPSEQTMGRGRSAIWTLPLVATQYQPSQPTPAMQVALQAQNEGRFLDALIHLDDAEKSAKADAVTAAELELLRSSFLLQGNQSRQAIANLAPLLGTRHAADAYALTAMAHLQQEQMQQALDAAQHAQGAGGGMLPPLALSYALQGMGRLAEARGAMHDFNGHAPQSAIALAREAELALTLDQVQPARTLVAQANALDAAHPYVNAVSGLVYLIDGHAQEAKSAFEAALQRDPKDAKALLGLGLAEIKLGNFKAGQQRLQAANEADPGNALILTYLGRSQQQLGQTDAARASWRRAQLADPRDPIPWLYQAQAELRANRPMEARESVREAQARVAYRSVYRGERLLREDEQLLQANLAEVQRQLGMEGLAFQTLSGPVGEKSTANLRDQASLLQGQRFGESARRSLLLQSQFNDRPGNLPPELDVYGDGAGQTGATTPQHGVVSGLGAQHASYNDYDELFSRPTTLAADATAASHHTWGEQVRVGVGSDTLGLGIAQRRFKTDGSVPFEDLDNRIWQGIVQWRPSESTQAFVSHQTFDSRWGAVFYPADPVWLGTNNSIADDSRVTRLGLRHSLTDDDELRVLWSRQQTDQTIDSEWITFPFPFSQFGSSSARSGEVQYRRSGSGYATQWGVQQVSAQLAYWDDFGTPINNFTQDARQFYAAWQQLLNPSWQVDMGLGWGKIDNRDDTGLGNSTYLARWLPRLGVVYTPDSVTHVRLAAWRGMGVPGTGDATLAPVTLSGILLSRPGDDGKLVHGVALGVDRQVSATWLLAAETQQRRTDLPAIQPSGHILLRQQTDESRLALHWQPDGDPWAVSLAYDYERIQNDPQVFALDSVQEQSLRAQRLDLRWFANAQWTVNCSWSHNRVAGLQQAHDAFFSPLSLPYQDGFNQLDANLNWKFNGVGILSAGLRNATNAHFQYTEVDKLSPRFSNRRLVYGSLKLAW
jgi:Tfp pilus assembly protein PilF